MDRIDNLQKVICAPGINVREAIGRIDASTPHLFQIVVDAQGSVLGTLTDGDIRRNLACGLQLDATVGECMYTPPTVGLDGETEENSRKLWGRRFLPVCDDGGRLLYVLVEPQRWRKIARALVMAGGFGKRFGEHTKQQPKPLLEVAHRPILDHVLGQLEEAEIPEVHIAVHYLAEQIVNFVDARNNLAEIHLINEAEPLGTAGALGSLPANLEGPLLVINGDVLTEVDLAALTEFHFRHGYDGTIGAAPYEVDVPYGVLRHDDSGLFTGVDEKPTYKYLVAGGFYLLSPQIVGLVSPDRPVDMPEVLEAARSAGFRLGIFPVHEYWRDIGRPDDLKSAHDERTSNEHTS